MSGRKNQKVVLTGYEPRPLQLILHRELRRFSVIVCHRRFGKTIFSINHMIDRALRCRLPMPRFAYIAPTYGQAKRVVWDQLKHYTQNIPDITPNEAELRVDIPFNGARIMLLSAENPSSLKGIYLDGVILDEYAEMNPAAWSEVIRPTLSDRKGWAIFIGTPKGQNNFYKLHSYAKEGTDLDWYTAVYRASETGILDEYELESAKRTMSEDEYDQEYECSFTAALSGAYFGKELVRAEKEGRITQVAYDPTLVVDTYWDLGLNDATAIWFGQTVRGQTRMIDYYEITGASLPEIVADLQAKRYPYGQFVLPHDAKARDLSTGVSQAQTLYKLGCRNVKIVPRVGTKRESINAARMALAKTVFDADKCKKGLDLLAQYQRKWDAKNNVYADTPLHNHASNCADAFQQYSMAIRDSVSSAQGFDEQDGGMANLVQAETEYNPLEYGGA
jgi:phage terminase large subunit